MRTCRLMSGAAGTLPRWPPPASFGGAMKSYHASRSALALLALLFGVTFVSAQEGAPKERKPSKETLAKYDANHDGTLWHCDGTTANAFRYISEQPYAVSLSIPNVTSIQQVASSAYGNALLLVDAQGARELPHASKQVLATQLIEDIARRLGTAQA